MLQLKSVTSLVIFSCSESDDNLRCKNEMKAKKKDYNMSSAAESEKIS